MAGEVSGPLSPSFTSCPCCGHWGSDFPAHCASDLCRWQKCRLCQAIIGFAGAHISGGAGHSRDRCGAAEGP